MPGYFVLRQFAMTPLGATRGTLSRGTAGGQNRQKRRGSLGFVGVGAEATASHETPARAKNLAEKRDAGGGTRTPDTRIMIPSICQAATCKLAANGRFQATQ